VQWERRVRKSLNAMSTELKAPLQGQIRNQTEKEELQAKWDELSNFQVDLSNYRPVYAPKDLLEVLLSLKGPGNQKQEEPNDVIPKWEFSHLALPVKNLFDLRILFSELLRNEMTSADWSTTCEKILATRHAPLCQQILKKGQTPTPFRGKLWSIVLGSELEEHVSDRVGLSSRLINFFYTAQGHVGRTQKQRPGNGSNRGQVGFQGCSIDCHQR